MDVMFYEAFREEEQALKACLPEEMKAGFTQDTIQIHPSDKPPAPLISVRTQSVIPSTWAGSLKGILTRSQGFDHLLRYQKTSGVRVPCGYLPAYCSRSVAEHALLITLMLLGRIKKQLRQFDSFDRNDLTGRECLGCHLLVVGVGNIGREIVALGRAVGMRVKGVDLLQRDESLEYVALEEGICFADVIVCALPLTRLTRGLLGYESLRHAAKGALFINVSRGEIAPVKDLKRLLDEKVLGGIGLDTYEDEHALAEYLRSGLGCLSATAEVLMELKNREDVILTPHNAFNTRESVEKKSRQSADAAVIFIRKGIFPNPVPDEE